MRLRCGCVYFFNLLKTSTVSPAWFKTILVFESVEVRNKLHISHFRLPSEIYFNSWPTNLLFPVNILGFFRIIWFSGQSIKYNYLYVNIRKLHISSILLDVFQQWMYMFTSTLATCIASCWYKIDQNAHIFTLNLS